MSLLPAEIAATLKRMPASRWHMMALLLNGEDGSARLMSRGELTSWLRANDLGTLAHEAGARRVAPGAILALILRDAGPKFVVLADPAKGAR